MPKIKERETKIIIVSQCGKGRLMPPTKWVLLKRELIGDCTCNEAGCLNYQELYERIYKSSDGKPNIIK